MENAGKTKQVEDDLVQKAKDLGIQYFVPWFSTLNWSQDFRGVIVPSCAIGSVMREGYGAHGIGGFDVPLSEPELFPRPDLHSLVQLPWDTDMAWVPCDLYFKGEPFNQCPRQALKRVLAKAKDMGFSVKCGIEPEFMLLDKDKHQVAMSSDPSLVNYYQATSVMSTHGYNHGALFREILSTLTKLEWKPLKAHHEAGSNQYEVNFEYDDAMKMADRHAFVKFMIKNLALKHGMRASFMPQPFSKSPFGNGMHLNISLWDLEGKVNMFPGEGEMGLSDVARHFLAGVIHHARSTAALLCPSANSYKRLYSMPNFLVNICYGYQNRWSMVRIPESNRLECRHPDSAVNPYLMQATIIAAGLDGITNKMEPDPALCMREDMMNKPLPAGIPQLPRTLRDATDLLEENQVMKDYLGKELMDAFIKGKRDEWTEYNKQVTQVEIDQADAY